MMNIRALLQTASLALFLLLLWLAVFPGAERFPVDLFLRFDPLVSLGTIISSRNWIPALMPGLAVLALTLFFGRLFCGYICPMGNTIDISDRAINGACKYERRITPERSASLRKVKYYVLLFVLGTAILGISSVFLASPLSLITRLYGLIIYPSLVFIAHGLLDMLYPLNVKLGLNFLAYAEFQSYRFSGQWFVVIFFIVVMGLINYAPRFWCRYICPSGAMMAIVGRRPLVRRKGYLPAALIAASALRHAPRAP
ncbi:MAG: 4Fe-4S binding protein [Syntrophales bacterium]|nr:4Fe-4S binding protein [Syntrophales bacterium]